MVDFRAKNKQNVLLYTSHYSHYVGIFCPEFNGFFFSFVELFYEYNGRSSLFKKYFQIFLYFNLIINCFFAYTVYIHPGTKHSCPEYNGYTTSYL